MTPAMAAYLRSIFTDHRVVPSLPTIPGIVDDRDKNALQDFVLPCNGDERAEEERNIYIYIKIRVANLEHE